MQFSATPIIVNQRTQLHPLYTMEVWIVDRGDRSGNIRVRIAELVQEERVLRFAIPNDGPSSCGERVARLVRKQFARLLPAFTSGNDACGFIDRVALAAEEIVAQTAAVSLLNGEQRFIASPQQRARR